VLSTIRHLGEDLYELNLRSADGTTDSLGVTAPHRFYSETRGWVAAAGLVEGEILRGHPDHGGPVVVTGISRLEGTRPVYNFSVEADHVYYAGATTTLTHNSYGIDEIVKRFGGTDACLEAGNCSIIAREAAELFGRRGKTAEIIRARPGEVLGSQASRSIGYVLNGKWIGLGDYHDVVRVGNKVYDAVFPGGIDFDDWWKAVDGFRGATWKVID
jgi:hypothetical protein